VDSQFVFDDVFERDVGQKEVYERSGARAMTSALFDGCSGVVFAYGATGSGKTFCIEGEDPGKSAVRQSDNDGLIARAARDVFALLEQKKRRGDESWEITVSYLEIYNEQCFDLLSAETEAIAKTAAEQDAAAKEEPVEAEGGFLEKKRKEAKPRKPRRTVLKLKEDRSGRVYPQNINIINVATVTDLLSAVSRGRDYRRVESTLSNSHSSRSHTLFNITLRRTAKPYLNATLAIIDLAGSERASRTQTSGARLREAGRINCSLAALARCLATMRENDRRREAEKPLKIVPFRESKLTRLIQFGLEDAADAAARSEGRAAPGAIMIVAVSGDSRDAEETVHALKVAAIAREIKSAESEMVNDSMNAMREMEEATKQQPKPPVRGKENQLPYQKPPRYEAVPGAAGAAGATGARRRAVIPHAERSKASAAMGAARKSPVATRKSPVAARQSPVGMANNALAVEKRKREALEKQVAELKTLLIESEERAATIEARVREEVFSEMEELLRKHEERALERFHQMKARNEEHTERRVNLITNTARKKLRLASEHAPEAAPSPSMDDLRSAVAAASEREEHHLKTIEDMKVELSSPRVEVAKAGKPTFNDGKWSM